MGKILLARIGHLQRLVPPDDPWVVQLLTGLFGFPWSRTLGEDANYNTSSLKVHINVTSNQ